MKADPVKGRFMMVTRGLPAESGGTMIVIRRLLENFDADEVVVLGRTPYKKGVLKNERPLHYPIVKVPMVYWKGFRLWRILSIIFAVPIGLFSIWKYRVKIIVGVYPDMGSLTTAYILSTLSRKTLLAYFCDLYAENQKPGLHGMWAKYLQPRIFKRARKIIAVNEGMRSFYEEKYGIEPLCLPTAINGEPSKNPILPELKNTLIIGYSGSIVLDRLDPFQALIATVGNNPNYEIRIFTPQSEEYLRIHGLWANNVSRKFCRSQEELMEELAQCHLLYLPLTFKTGKGYNSIAQLATCFGIKSYEYFLSCRPVLVQCPKNYFTSTFFEENNCGYILGSIENEAILKKLGEIQQDYQSKASKLVENALMASQAFNGEKLAGMFTRTLNESIA